MDIKRNLGQYFTKSSVWLRPQIKRFIAKAKPSIVIDPFAGAGDLLKVANDLGYGNVDGYDIDPKLGWKVNDGLRGLKSIENGLILTNPPYLAKNSAKRRNLDSYAYFLDNNLQDLYQIAIRSILQACRYSVLIIPETFLVSGMFVDSIDSITILEENPFEDTDCPTCVCCFDSAKMAFLNSRHHVYDIYKNDLFLFNSQEAETRLATYKAKIQHSIKFNDATGNLGLRGIDGINSSDRIKFCFPQELCYDLSNIKTSSRAITVVKVDTKVDTDFLTQINYYFEDYRAKTHDVFMAPFKNNNSMGIRRRRIDFKLARNFINKTIEILDK